MKFIIPIIFLLLIPIVYAETTFFDNPDDVFIMGSPATTGEVILGGTQEVTTGGSCTYKWNCTTWDECLSYGKQTRDCTNIGTCPDAYKTPEIEQNCTYTASEAGENKKAGEINDVLSTLKCGVSMM